MKLASQATSGFVLGYGIIVAPVSIGRIQQGDVLVDNFNNLSNLQGTGTTIVAFNPTTKRTFTFARLPQRGPQFPGGIGLTTAMTMLKSGWIIVGSLPSLDGTMRTKSDGALLVLDPNGELVAVWTGPNRPSTGLTRRHFLALTGSAAMVHGAESAARALDQDGRSSDALAGSNLVPFWGAHQAGIATPVQAHSYFAAFDLQTSKRGEVADMLRAWTRAAANLAMGRPASPLADDPDQPGADSADALEIAPSRLTMTFGFGSGLFVKDGVDRYGLASRRPEALVDLPTTTA